MKYATQFISSSDFFKMCDHRAENPSSEWKEAPKTYPTKAGEIVYCHPTALENFVSSYLPNVKFSFILLSGDSDMSVPTDCRDLANVVLAHPLLIKWFAQNCVEPSEKLIQLPIGLNYHTMEIGNSGWGPKQSTQSQENDVLRLRNNPIRQSKCYANFQFVLWSRYASDRKLAMAQIPKPLIFYEPIKCSRIRSWTNMVNYKYVVSPHGNGLDCHRTWEALVLGCIPIVKTSPLDPMFADLPVLIVKEWSDITQELLDTFVPPSKNIQKLYLSYWKNLFTQIPFSEQCASPPALASTI